MIAAQTTKPRVTPNFRELQYPELVEWNNTVQNINEMCAELQWVVNDRFLASRVAGFNERAKADLQAANLKIKYLLLKIDSECESHFAFLGRDPVAGTIGSREFCHLPSMCTTFEHAIVDNQLRQPPVVSFPRLSKKNFEKRFGKNSYSSFWNRPIVLAELQKQLEIAIPEPSAENLKRLESVAKTYFRISSHPAFSEFKKELELVQKCIFPKQLLGFLAESEIIYSIYLRSKSS